MVMISSLCFRATSNNSSRVARSPSSPSTSQSTPAGANPAIRARSTDASVWPARRRTPPSFAVSKWTWPGRTKSSTVVSGFTISRTHLALSSAVIPVFAVTWSRGVTKAVPKLVLFCSTIGFRSKRRQTSGRTGMQKSPRPLMIKLMFSGVAISAAQTKSPSFSRDSSSTTITTSPRRIASTAAGIEENSGLSAIIFLEFFRCDQLWSKSECADQIHIIELSKATCLFGRP